MIFYGKTYDRGRVFGMSWTVEYIFSCFSKRQYIYVIHKRLFVAILESSFIGYRLSFLDSVIGICYDNFNPFKNMVDKVPVNNVRTFELMQLMMMQEESGCVDALLQENTIHKLTYKYEYAKGPETVYYKVVKSSK